MYGPRRQGLGTDIYDAERRWSAAHRRQLNSAVIFIAEPNAWHGLDPRPINGVRRQMEINYVAGWRDRGQLAFPERQIET